MSNARTTALAQPTKLSAYIALTKPDVSFLVLMTTGAGFYMGARGPIPWLHMLHVIFGTMMIAAGTAALNHYIERELDRYMRRTASRPLPTGQLAPVEALRFGVALCLVGAVDLYFTAGYIACLRWQDRSRGRLVTVDLETGPAPLLRSPGWKLAGRPEMTATVASATASRRLSRKPRIGSP